MKLLVLVGVLAAAPAFAQPKYPPTKTVDASDTYFGKIYKDPYRWLERLKDKDVEAWFKANADLTDGLLAKIPGRDALVEEWMKLDKLEPATLQRRSASRTAASFYKKTLGGENVGRLFYREGWTGAEKLLFDPETYKARRQPTTINSIAAVVGWQVRGARADVRRRRVLGAPRARRRRREAAAGEHVSVVRPGGWTMDSKSFFYDAGKVTDIKSLGDRAQPQDARCTCSARRSRAIAICSATRAIPSSASRAKEFPASLHRRVVSRLPARQRRHGAERDAALLRADRRS